MSTTMARRTPIKEQRLAELEAEFEPLLRSCLRACARGRWGLFGQNDYPEAARYEGWPEADRLKEMAKEIRELRAEFGQPNPLCQRLDYYCNLRGSNIPGEPKLARVFLNEIEGRRQRSSDSNG